MIALLLRRTLADRPRRTVLLLFGFGIAVGVMITLLSIGSAVLEQARDKDLVGGGDLVLLPQGVDVEVLKIGGATGMFYAIDDASFVYRQMLSGPRFAPRLASLPAPAWPNEPPAPPLAAASPVLANKVVYVRRHRDLQPPRRALANGFIPSLDRAVRGSESGASASAADASWQDSPADRQWMDPPVDSLYHALDRFHRPPAGTHDLDRWAEWWYFNFSDPVSGRYAFLSFIVAGDVASGAGRALPLLQIVRPGMPPARFAADLPLGATDVSFERADVRLGTGTHAWFHDGKWRLQLDFATPSGHVRGALDVEPVRDLLQPPFVIHDSEQFVSGYVVPAIRGRVNGWIEAGRERLELRDAPAYHDHNWGTWRDVNWDWGTASTWEHGLFYGRIEHPELRAGAGMFAVLAAARTPTARGGFLALFRPGAARYEWNDAPPQLPGAPSRIPVTLQFEADSLRVAARVEDVLASAPGTTADSLVFLQAQARFEVHATVAGHAVQFTGPGFAETFVRRSNRRR